MTSPFRLPIADLLQTGGSRDVTVSGPGGGWGVELSRAPAEATVEGDFTLTAVGGGIVVRGVARLPVKHTCYRCLTEWDDVAEAEISELFADATLDGVDYEIEGDDIDLEPLLIDELTLAMPLRPFDGCVELGEAAESDQNADPSGPESTSPFAVLKDLLEEES